jgi:hypothetical protein
MKQQIRHLIQQGLFRQNLLELISICEQLTTTKPAIYGSLINIFRLLEQEYEPHDAIDTPRYNSVNSLLRAPLLDLLNAEDQSAGAILLCLDRVMDAFERLSH